MKIESPDFKRQVLNQLMHTHEKANQKVKMGHVVIPTATRFPKEGSKANTEDEYSYIVQGEVIGEIADESFSLTAGDFIHKPAGSQQ